ncbi:MAG: glutathione peroxidase [Chloroflexota bacterium]
MSIGDIAVKTTRGEERLLGSYAGDVLLIVNVASRCGYTPQYAGLEELHRTYKDAGLRVLGFPSNDFGSQDPGNNSEIAEFCQLNYGVSFELFDKVHAIGPDQHPLYRRLTAEAGGGTPIEWNFTKFIVGRSGEVEARFAGSVKPDDPALVGALQAALAQPAP